jgi:uncharacterized protein
VELTHEFTVPTGVEETWAAFDDIESVAVCFPGAQVTSVEGDSFQGNVKVKLGPIALVYNGSGTFVEKDESSHTMKIEAKGKDRRGNGTAGANVVATMTDESGSTRVSVRTDLNITGKPAQFGRGVIQDVSDKLLGQFTDCLEQKLGGAGSAPAESMVAESAATTPEAASTVAGHATEQAKAEQELASPGPVTAAPPRARQPQSDDALDLGSTVLPVLLKSYWKQGVVGLVILLAIVRWIRR